MAPYSVLITGANRGIGLGLVKEFLKNKDIQHVIATARDTSAAKELNEISDKRLVILQLDVTCDESIKNLYTQVQWASMAVALPRHRKARGATTMEASLQWRSLAFSIVIHRIWCELI
ncbi:hypothetical protein Y032_0009g550 [Ancylostoma ceylanicum]|uniref:Oxidoreductase, short chain dehydrogenase/reductase family protein n=1 Tax=Ancylostoma ceylanicum TaxID=53326 RepID=A0A016VK77_9BILA|nr:hypothetical protein Y032_0009g550 [Ancylostoma ceylanicum]